MTTQDPVSTVVNFISLKASPSSHTDHILEASSNLLTGDHDAAIISSTGESIPTSRSLLSLASPMLRKLVASLPCCATTTIHLPDFSTHALKHLISILSHGFTTSQLRNDIFRDVTQLMDMAKLLDISIIDLSYEKDFKFVNRKGVDIIGIKEEAMDSLNMDEEIIAIEKSSSLKADKNLIRKENAIETLSYNSLCEPASSQIKKSTEKINKNVPNKKTLITEITKEFACPICPKTYTRRDKFNQHMNIHTGLKPYKCLNCGKGFSSILFKNNHFMKCLSGKELLTNLESDSGENKIKEKRTVLEGKLIPENAKSSKDVSQNEVEVNINLNNVEGKAGTNIKCKACLITFLTKSDLKLHVMSCDKCHKCPFCSTKFFHAGNIKRHVRTKHPHETWLVKDPRNAIDIPENDSNGTQSIYKCNDCSKAFMKENSLKAHMKKCHIRIKNIENKIKREENSEQSVDNDDSTSKVSDKGDCLEHTCDACGKEFSSEKGLTKHFKMGICFKFCCSLCPEKFKEKEDLDWHTDICHDISDTE